MITRLIPLIYLLTPLGKAEAHFLWNSDSFEVSASYGCFMDETKENWWWPNTQVRLCESITAERSREHTDFHLSDALLETLRPHILRHRKSPFYEWAIASDQAAAK